MPLVRMLMMMLLPVLLLGGCDGSSASCSDVCAKTVTECQASSSMNECETSCKKMRDALNVSAFDTITACVLESSCAALSTDTCFTKAVDQISDTATGNFVERMCEKLVPCSNSALSTEACVSQSEASLGDLLAVLKLFKPSLVDCLSACIEGEDCTALTSNTEDVVESCTKSCGFVFGTTSTDVTVTPISD